MRTLFFALLFLSFHLQAQDYSFAQYWLVPQGLNPAYSGLNIMRNEDFLFSSNNEFDLRQQQIAHKLSWGLYWPKNPDAKAIYKCGVEFQYYDEPQNLLYQQTANSQVAIHSSYSYPFSAHNSLSIGIKALYGLSSAANLGAPRDFKSRRPPLFAEFYPRLDYQVGLIWEHYHPKNENRNLRLGMAIKQLNQKASPFQPAGNEESIVPAVEFLIHADLEEQLFTDLFGQAHHFSWSSRQLLQPLRGHQLRYQFGLNWKLDKIWQLKTFNGLDFQYYQELEGIDSPYPSAIWDITAGSYWSYMGSLGFEYNNLKNRRLKHHSSLQFFFNYQFGIDAKTPDHFSLSFHYSTFRRGATRLGGLVAF